MRILLGLLVLFAAFGLALLWQESYLEELRREHAADGDAAAADATALPPGWGLVVVGRPSEAPPLKLTGPPGPAHRSPPAGSTPAAEGAGEPRQPDHELRVLPGERLWDLAERHYGGVGPRLIQALSAYNGLVDPDQLTAGQVLYFPPREVLTALTAGG